MLERGDTITKHILHQIEVSSEPLETKEIEQGLKDISRVKVFYRLNLLRGDGLIKGKPVGSGKGTWIWWSKERGTGGHQ